MINTANKSPTKGNVTLKAYDKNYWMRRVFKFNVLELTQLGRRVAETRAQLKWSLSIGSGSFIYYQYTYTYSSRETWQVCVCVWLHLTLYDAIDCSLTGFSVMEFSRQEYWSGSVSQFSSVTQSCPTLCDLMNHSTPGLPVHHQLPEFTQTQVHRVRDAIHPSHPWLSPSPPAPNPSQHQSLFQWVNSLHEVAKVREFQL